MQPMHQPVAHFKTTTRLALFGATQEPLIGLHQVNLPFQVTVAHLLLVQVTQCGGGMQHAAVEGLPVTLRRLHIGRVDAFAEVVLLAKVEPGSSIALQGRHAQQVPGQHGIGPPVLAVEPDPAEVVQCGHATLQCLAAQVDIHRLQVVGLIQAVDQQRPLAGQAHTGEQPLSPSCRGRRGDDPLGQKAGK